MLPRLTFEELTKVAEGAVKPSHSSQPPRVATMPLIPPRTTPTVNTVMKSSEDPSWFVVISPRETRGLAGPLSIAQLKQMYKVGEITDRTLVWQEGEINWQQLVHHSFLRSQLIYLPILPPRVGNYNAELAVFDPIVDVPAQAAESLVPLEQVRIEEACKQCGNIAAFHCSKLGEQIPDLFKCRTEVGTNEYASEVLPGLLWVGSSQAVKHRSIQTIGFTLIINCTKNMKNPAPQPPHFRCKYCPLPEAPTNSFVDDEVNDIIALLEVCYDWIELERTAPDVVAKGDPLPKPWRGPTDSMGQPIKGAAEKLAFKHKLEEGQKSPSPRVLIWSKFGTDRSSFVAAAYMIKNFGISVSKAMNIVKATRPETRMSHAFLQVLQKWEGKYLLGLYLCVDCAEEKKLKLQEQQQQEARETTKKQQPDFLEQCAEYFRAHLLPCASFGEDDDEEAGEAGQIGGFGDPSEYVVRLAINKFPSSPWSGLVDIELPDRRLSDRTLAVFFQAAAECRILPHIRMLNLRNNIFGVLASRALLLAYYRKLNADPDDEYYLEDEMFDPDSLYPSLTVLDLSNIPHFEETNVRYLCLFLKQCRSLMTLNLFGCHIEDYLLAQFISCLVKPTSVFQSLKHGHEDESSVFTEVPDLFCNESITDLNIGRNSLGAEAAAALTQMFKQNAVIATLRLEVCTAIAPKDWKSICNAIRLYNSSLTELVLHSNSLSVKTCEYLGNIHSSLGTRIEKVRLPMCGLQALHVMALSKHLPIARYLRELDLSCNRLGDDAVPALCAIIEGSTMNDGTRLPPLETLDFNSCGLTPAGCAKIVTAISKRGRLLVLDLSNNCVGPKNDEFLASIGSAAIVDLRLNYCHLKNQLSEALFRILAHRSRSHVGDPSNVVSLVRGKLLENLRFLGMAGNEISDSTAEALCDMLDHNISLEALDLGFNAYTKNSLQFFQHAVKVTSESAEEKKVYPLHINLIGNKCDPYLLAPPGMSRSKVNFHFGAYANLQDPMFDGYSHVESRIRGKFAVQKQLEEVYRRTFPVKPLNHVT